MTEFYCDECEDDPARCRKARKRKLCPGYYLDETGDKLDGSPILNIGTALVLIFSVLLFGKHWLNSGEFNFNYLSFWVIGIVLGVLATFAGVCIWDDRS